MALNLFHGSLSGETPSGALSFFGQLLTAVERAESLFMNHGYWRVYRDGKFLLIDMAEERVAGEETPEKTLLAFADFMEQVSIKSFNVDIQNPLRLVDCWEDDPIGSGAMQIFNECSGLTQEQIRQLERLFHPYKDIIHPEHVAMLSSAQEIKTLLDEASKDPVFVDELEKRRVRSEKIGIPFNLAMPQEIVWTSLTVKLMRWAQAEGYDGFIYEGAHERAHKGVRLDDYVTFGNSQVSEGGTNMRFKKEDFLKAVLPSFPKYLSDYIEGLSDHTSEQQAYTFIYWGGTSPLEHWELT